MKFNNYYELMGLSADASQDAIKQTYRHLVRKYHPDVSTSPDALERFKEIGEAYKVLKDTERRIHYDQIRRLGRANQSSKMSPRRDRGGQSSRRGHRKTAEFEDFFRTGFSHPAGPGHWESGACPRDRETEQRSGRGKRTAANGLGPFLLLLGLLAFAHFYTAGGHQTPEKASSPMNVEVQEVHN